MLGLLSKPQAAANLFAQEAQLSASTGTEADTAAAMVAATAGAPTAATMVGGDQPRDAETVNGSKHIAKSIRLDPQAAQHNVLESSEGHTSAVESKDAVLGAVQRDAAQIVMPGYRTVGPQSLVAMEMGSTQLAPLPNQAEAQANKPMPELKHDLRKDRVREGQLGATHTLTEQHPSKGQAEPLAAADLPIEKAAACGKRVSDRVKEGKSKGGPQEQSLVAKPQLTGRAALAVAVMEAGGNHLILLLLLHCRLLPPLHLQLLPLLPFPSKTILSSLWFALKLTICVQLAVHVHSILQVDTQTCYDIYLAVEHMFLLASGSVHDTHTCVYMYMAVAAL